MLVSDDDAKCCGLLSSCGNLVDLVVAGDHVVGADLDVVAWDVVDDIDALRWYYVFECNE